MSHAILSASAAHRWMNCPPSARLALQYPSTTSSYAEEGSAAHALAERRLGVLLELARINVAWSRLAPSDRVGPARDDALLDQYADASMYDYINDYTAQVMEHVMAAKDPYVLLEQRLEFGEYIPQGFGTGDVIILADGTLEIIDLKYGKGVPVDAVRNPQLMLYGLGALLTYGQLYDVQDVRVTIMQPRLDSESSYTIPAGELLAWADEEVRPLAQLAWDGGGEFKCGDWCRFCPAAGDCRARAAANVELAKATFKDPATLRDDEVAEILAALPDWEAWAKDLKERTLERVLHEGAHIPGYKLVLGRSTRRYNNKQTVMDVLEANGHSLDDVAPREPLGITAMTKLLGKKRFENELGNLIGYMSGKPTLVPETDKRAEYVPAAEAFKGYTDETEN